MSAPGHIELRVTPAEGVTDAYAAASGDDNPIHVDAEFATSVGLPGRILHGLWTAAQVARAATSVTEATGGPVLGAGAEAHYALASLSVQFRGMGVIGPEILVAGTSSDAVDGVVTVTLGATQDGTRLVRNATARVRVSTAP